jgi:hypothetical protein
MISDHATVLIALADLDAGKLDALIATADDCPQIAPGLLAWIDGACDWEVNWRRGFDYPLQAPEAAIPPEDDVVSIDAAIATRGTFP